MADTALKEEAIWEEIIRLIETTDTVIGGENGVPNIAPRQLANRTLYLKNLIEKHLSDKNPHSQYINNEELDKALAKLDFTDYIKKEDAYEKFITKKILMEDINQHKTELDPHSQYVKKEEMDLSLYVKRNEISYQSTDMFNVEYPIGTYLTCSTTGSEDYTLPLNHLIEPYTVENSTVLHHRMVWTKALIKSTSVASHRLNGVWRVRGVTYAANRSPARLIERVK